jgi:hypothetical protein
MPRWCSIRTFGDGLSLSAGGDEVLGAGRFPRAEELPVSGEQCGEYGRGIERHEPDRWHRFMIASANTPGSVSGHRHRPRGPVDQLRAVRSERRPCPVPRIDARSPGSSEASVSFGMVCASAGR